ncbi:MAG: aminotransferase class I/II-fold pyridoxal phosphate-dependent enzyme, partial [Proteobacteria bacterium]|nr:aminotransferase class I/II-fold pyridoxal phosphate-dependent enzyme [Pseudomonadota bacterium]
PDLRGREARELAQCVEDNWVSSAGPFVSEFEIRMAALTGRRRAVATVNGTAAIHLALLGAGIEPGDRVIVPDWTFAASTNAIYHAGAEPFLVDVTHDSWTLDADLVADTLRAKDHRVKAIIAVHALGLPADIDAIREAANGLPIIEDAAGAIGAHYKGKHVGKGGAFATFSFNGNKTVTAGGGGMVVCDDEDAAIKIRHLSTQARVGERYTHDQVGFNYRMTNLNAAVGLAQLERLDEMVTAKRAIASRYDTAISNRADLAAMPRPEWAESSCWLYSVMTATPEDGASLIKAMKNEHIEAREFWRSLADQAPFSQAPKLLSGVSASLTGRIISLPSSSHLSEDDRSRVIDVIKNWRGNDMGSAP